MAELAKKLHLKKGTTEHIAKAYSTTAEAGAEYITNIIDGVTAYIPIGATNDSRATMGRVKKPAGTEKAILTMGKPPYAKKQWTTPGTHTFTVPAGVTVIAVTVAGAGGGGSGYAYNEYDEGRSGGAGGKGALMIAQTASVTSQSTLPVVVGVGGGAGKSNIHIGTYNYKGEAGGNGGTSSVAGVTAAGGQGGHTATIDGSTHGNLGSAASGANAGDGRGSTGGAGGSIHWGSDSDGSYIKGATGASSGEAGWVVIEYGGNVKSDGCTVKQYTSVGTFPFTVPDGVTSISVEVADGGNGFQDGDKIDSDGEAGLWAFDFVDVTPGTNATIVVGGGGATNNSGEKSSAFGVTTNGAHSRTGGAGGTSGATTGKSGWVILRYWG